MLFDLKNVAAETPTTADLCILGAGVAGLTVASEFLHKGLRVILLDSGPANPTEIPNPLNQGSCTSDRYPPLEATRQRGFGGTMAYWNTIAANRAGAKLIFFDSADFAPRPDEGVPGWPIPFDEVNRFVPRALRRFGIDSPFGGSEPKPEDPSQSPFSPPLVLGAYRFGSREAFLSPFLEEVAGSPNVHLISETSVVGFDVSDSGGELRAMRALGSGGQRIEIRAKHFVLAAGAIENARLLLNAGPGVCSGPSEEWVGRCFMEHPRDYSLRLSPTDSKVYRRLAWLDFRERPPHGFLWGRVGLSEEVLLGEDLLNVGATLLPETAPWARTLGRRVDRSARFTPIRDFFLLHKQGWSDHVAPGVTLRDAAILLNLEQPPRMENRVELGSKQDPFGVPYPHLHWEWNPEDDARLNRIRRIFASGFENAGLGQVTIDPGVPFDPGAHHHAGTTRMAENPEEGVVNPDGRVFSMNNLFVAGGSVFPRSGFANPTLPIVSLSLRLADHLAEVFQRNSEG